MRHWCTRNIFLAALLAAGADCLVGNNSPAPTLRQCALPNGGIGTPEQQQQTQWCLSQLHRTGGGSAVIASSQQTRQSRLQLRMSDNSREEEIRKKIQGLKEEGKLESNSQSVGDEYAEKLASKMGVKRARQVGRMLGIAVPFTSPKKDTTTETSEDEDEKKRKPKLGALDVEEEDGEEEDDLYETETEDERRERMVITSEAASDAIGVIRQNLDEEEEEEDEMDEEDMLDAVNKALAKNGFRSRASSFDVIPAEDKDTSTTETDFTNTNIVSSTVSTGVKTSGIGGTWAPQEGQIENAYQPKVGTWGVFDRPKDISAAYGGGKRVGADVKIDRKAQQQSIDSTKDRLAAYREKMGIEVQSEKDHVDIINEALELAARAMQRGSYGIGVSVLEKVTQYCSTRSKLGGKVFLELAMAYEAEGKTDQAIGLYAALGKSPIEQIKNNADKLLYGLEAMNFMRNEAKLKDFSRKKAADTFIDATGFGDITKNFDNVYNTAYIDLDKGSQYYRMLTENAVRSTREARQILLKAVSSGEVPRMKVVQSLRSISRHFDDALVVEKENEEAKNIPVDYAGRPIVSIQRSTQEDLASEIGMDGFILLKPSQTMANLDGEWRLQLLGDRKGEGVEFFNSTLIWQAISTSEMSYSSGSKGLRSSSQSGDLKFGKKERILSREGISTNNGGMGGGGFFSMLLGGGSGTAGEMAKIPQQVLSVDSVLLITRAIVKAQAADNVKGYFSVWRRVDTGTYGSGT
mmetsp:Transcript_22877/g.49494  ORF Transcript_22877/g.49494 Transcript_22877/m.49494 type:complete len:748 (-) Transcript_22877:145-2388(-)